MPVNGRDPPRMLDRLAIFDDVIRSTQFAELDEARHLIAEQGYALRWERGVVLKFVTVGDWVNGTNGVRMPVQKTGLPE